MIKIVKASNNSIAAGGDVTINVSFNNGVLDDRSLLREIQEKSGLNSETLIHLFGEAGHNISTAKNLIERLTLDALVQSPERADKYGTISSIVAVRRKEIMDLESALVDVSQAIRGRNYDRAHKGLESILGNPALNERTRSEFVFDFFLTGYLYLANSGVSSEIQRLHDKAFREYGDRLDPMLLCLLAEMQQEVATRDLKDILLENCLVELEELLPRCEANQHAYEYCQILTALCLRRLGERGRVQLLERSISVHEELLQGASSRVIEISNNFGITLIRNFEATGDASSLLRAKSVLQSLEPPQEGSLVSEVQCFPKVLNNLGNVAKQMIVAAKSPGYLAQAIECYCEAEKYWNQATSPYEWAMLQKNKAESRLFHMQIFGFESALMDRALEEVHASLRYRTDTEASWQSRRSREVLDRLVAFQEERS